MHKSLRLVTIEQYQYILFCSHKSEASTKNEKGRVVEAERVE